ncbi:hypothetical protein CXF81_06135 [Glaciecola sp. 33A]|nr:hypothetical protein CXF81_06135 [Glaciecola sp. 33A]
MHALISLSTSCFSLGLNAKSYWATTRLKFATDQFGGDQDRYNQFFLSLGYVLKSTNFSHKFERRTAPIAVYLPIKAIDKNLIPSKNDN